MVLSYYIYKYPYAFLWYLHGLFRKKDIYFYCADPLDYERVKNAYILQNKMLEESKKNLRVLHPLPRVNEITEDVDSNPKAYYFQQAQNGVYVRQALLATILGKSIKN